LEKPRKGKVLSLPRHLLSTPVSFSSLKRGYYRHGEWILADIKPPSGRLLPLLLLLLLLPPLYLNPYQISGLP
jgi:hypothetical protein